MPGSSIVIDASVALRWLLPDALSGICWKLFEQIVNDKKQIHVPVLWRYEVTSGLAKAVHFELINPQEAEKLLRQSQLLDVTIIPPDNEQDIRALSWTMKMHRGSVYDSYYLALAELLGCEFWTADQNLFNAANIDWVRWIEQVKE
jgi:predicted nucleic acid-binding protein